MERDPAAAVIRAAPMLLYRGYRLDPVSALRDDLVVGSLPEDHRETHPHHLLMVGHHDPDLRSSCVRSGRAAVTGSAVRSKTRAGTF